MTLGSTHSVTTSTNRDKENTLPTPQLPAIKLKTAQNKVIIHAYVDLMKLMNIF